MKAGDLTKADEAATQTRMGWKTRQARITPI
jgi:hypothetical protein